MKFVIVPGINTKLGEGPHKLKPYFEAAGHEVHCINYYHRWWQTRTHKHKVIHEIAEALEDADVLVGHSNGPNYAYRALSSPGRRNRKLLEFRLSPALNRNVGTHADKCFVFHTESDWVVKLSSYRVRHLWGRQGALGYKGPELGISMFNRNYTEFIRDHGDWNIKPFIDRTANDILELSND